MTSYSTEMCQCDMSNAAHCRPPALTDEAVSELVSTLFPFCSVEAGSPSELASFEDRNYYFRGALEPEPAGSSYVTTTVKAQTEHFLLKVSHSSFNREICKAINDVMRFVLSEGFNCSCPVLTRSGEDVAMVTAKQLTSADEDMGVHTATERQADHQQFCVRVFTFIPGVQMRAVADLSPTTSLLKEVGYFIGRMALSLKGFSNDEMEGREFIAKYMDLKYFSDINASTALSTIEDSVHRKMVLDTVHDFNEHVAPTLPSRMQSGILHGDAHDGNIILDRDANHVAGIIDFNNCHTSCYLFELAIALACNMQRMVNPVRDACPFICGFVKAFPLSDDELDCLFVSVLARLCVVAVVKEDMYVADPSRVYLRLSSALCWKLLHELRTHRREDVGSIWKRAIIVDSRND